MGRAFHQSAINNVNPAKKFSIVGGRKQKDHEKHEESKVNIIVNNYFAQKS